jgi:hypothetical protein
VGTERRRARATAAAISGVAGVVLFVVLGGAGLAQTAVPSGDGQSGTTTAEQDVTPLQVPTGKKVVICHKLKNTISVSVHAWPAHQRHGDTEGECAAAATAQAKTKKPKTSTLDATATSATTSAAEPTEQDETGSTSTNTTSQKQHKPKGNNARAARITSTTSGMPQAGNSGKPKKLKPQKHETPVPTGVTTPKTGPGRNGNGKGHANGKDT